MKTQKMSYRWVCLSVIFALVSMAGWCRAANRQPVAPQPAQPQPVQPQPGIEAPEGGEGLEVTEEAGDAPPVQTGGQPNLLALVRVTPTGSGREVQVNVTVSNGGGGTINAPFTVRWHPHEATDEVGCSWDIQAERINQDPVNRDCTYTYPQDGLMHWQVVVDAEGEIEETSKADNVVRGEVQVGVLGGGSGPLSAPENCRWRLASVPVVIVLEWGYPQGESVDGFVVYMATTDEQVRVGADQRQVMVPNLAPATQYHFDVRAVRGGQESPVDACAVDATTGQ